MSAAIRPARPPRRFAIALLALCSLLVGFGLSTGRASADGTQISMMQDDLSLIGSPNPTVSATLARMQSLGVEEIRVNVEWNSVAPSPESRTEPAGFVATNPNTGLYNWSAYDRIADLAPLYGIAVQFNLTGPGPLWAMAKGSPTARAATHWKPDPAQFYAFAYAAGERFSGADGVARVSNWSIWNEPNQPGWLAPQWLKVGRAFVAQSPRLYRGLINAGYYGLLYGGHPVTSDSIVIGETAPEGEDSGGFYTAMTPLPFLRDLYCVDAHERPLRGTAAAELGCPTRGSTRAFVDANAGLFHATGYAHHPYAFRHSPTYRWPDPNVAPLADIDRLEQFLDRTFSAYGVHRSLPLYFTEYGFETKPPDPHQIISPDQQAAYLNEADFMSWENPRVRSVAQFLLYDSAPDPRYRPNQYSYWDTFQTGLRYVGGAPKPAYGAYRMPLWLPQSRARRGQSVFLWGQARPADRQGAEPVALQWSASGKGAWQTFATVHTTAHTGYFTTHVRLPGTGYVRSRWSGIVGTANLDVVSETVTSRSVPVTVTR